MAEVRVTVDGLQQLISSIQKNNTDLISVKSAIDRTVNGTIWTGQAADKFKQSWSQQKSNLDKMSEMLEQVRKEVDERKRRLEVFEA
ncbi:MAG TPA: WXG100 family type VII secretion target [Chloroflexota bacterium]|nr:WXG100 family type VII secretion target [Chloroflexota bacterium]